METVEFSAIQVDRCTQCHGLFFDRREADRLKVTKGSEAIDIGDVEVGRTHSVNDRIRCPRDTTRMVPIVDTQQPHIHIETCPVCNGMFFDAGEFTDWKSESFLDTLKHWFSRSRG